MRVAANSLNEKKLSSAEVSDADLTAFHRNGWVKLGHVLGDSDLQRIHVLAKEMEVAPSAPRKVGRDGFGDDANNPDYLKRLQVLNLRATYPEIIAVAEKIAPIVAALMGVPSLRLWSDMLFIKKGDGDSKPTMWHQDLPKVPIDRRGLVNAWIAVDDVPVSRGAMAFASGSHRLGSLGAVSQLGEERDLTEILNNRDWDCISDLTTVPLKAGEATFHSGMTLHRAHANKDAVDRIGLGFHFIDADALFTGAASRYTDDLGLKAFEPFDERFPVVC
jgi:phytanoyl-CoA hydroxylase